MILKGLPAAQKDRSLRASATPTADLYDAAVTIDAASALVGAAVGRDHLIV